MINRKYLLTFLISIISLFIMILVLSSTTDSLITGNAIFSEIGVSINSIDDGRIIYFKYPSRIKQYSKMEIDVEFLNPGSTSYTKESLLLIGAYDENTTVLANRTGLIKFMNPGERNYDKFRYTPLNYGFYWMHLIISYADKTADAWGTFYVDPYYAIVIPSDGSGGTGDSSGTGGTGSSGGSGVIDGSGSGYVDHYPYTSFDSDILDSGRILVTLSHPDKIYVQPGQSSVVYVIVNNIGTMTLRRMMLLPSIIGDIKIDAQPKNIQTLKGNQSAIFMINLDVPYDIDNRTYPMDFEILFDKGNRTGHIDVAVGPLPPGEDLMNTILNYMYIITRLKSESDKLYIDGENTTVLDQHISLADSDLNIAKNYYYEGDYDNVRVYLKETREHMEEAALELANLRTSRTLIVFSPAIWLFILLAIIIVMAIVEMYIYKRKKKKEIIVEENPV